MTFPATWVVHLLISWAGLILVSLAVRWLWNYFVPPTGTVPKRYQVVPRE